MFNRNFTIKYIWKDYLKKLPKVSDREQSIQNKKELYKNLKLKALVEYISLPMDIKNVYRTAIVEFKLWLKNILVFSF